MEIVDEARTWIGTPFRLNGRVKKNHLIKSGVDCVGLIMEIAKNISYKDLNDKSSYKIKNNSLSLNEEISSRFTKSNDRIGNIILFELPKGYQHAGIISDIGIIHCCFRLGVIETRMGNLQKYSKYYYSII